MEENKTRERKNDCFKKESLAREIRIKTAALAATSVFKSLGDGAMFFKGMLAVVGHQGCR